MNLGNAEWLYSLLDGLNMLLIVYVICVSIFYMLLFFASAKQIRAERGLGAAVYEDALNSAFTPPLSIIVPAYNEEVGIVSSIRSLLSISYREYEIIVVNDGSKDSTIERVVAEFDMVEMKGKIVWSGLRKEVKPIRRVYRSRMHMNLFLIDKENGGKSDALNAGINLSKYPYFVSLDGDTVLEQDAFLKVVRPIMEARPGEEVICTGGSVGIANGSEIVSGHLAADRIGLSRNKLVVMQVIEYLRGFLMGRIALGKYNVLLIVSGAFGVFRKDWVIAAGGYEVGTVGEDMELIVRLHRLIRERKSNAKIVYIPDTVCWTEAPESMAVLKRQRTRWHRGLFESIWRHKKMLLNPRYGRIGLVAMPYYLFVELLGPLVEVLGYINVVINVILGDVYYPMAALLFVALLIYGSFLSMGAVLLEEWSMRKYPLPSHLIRLFLYSASETFWYRPIMTWWRLIGLFEAIRGKKHGWGDMARKAGVMDSRKSTAPPG
ncbi:glycosyltransferase family 2 protein [Paenibacillus silviterrae]|uniref:glycosyltransferase family 2 protein n=1 Tax=Paenibacillus silviterrae TaxID=3242194 RepID=UPI002543D21F|nr:glycosyltransferase [Paenibacillus chinjuensis]